MPKEDLNRFLKKVDQLNQMIDSLESIKGRKKLLEACTHHDQVVELANSWGYQIGTRWGEHSSESLSPFSDNLLSRPMPNNGIAKDELIQETENIRLTLTLLPFKYKQKSIWYKLDNHKWVLILSGGVEFALRNPDSQGYLKAGDYLYLPQNSYFQIITSKLSLATRYLSLDWKDME